MAKSSKKDDQKRLNISLDFAVYEELLRMRKLTKAESLTSVIRRSIAVYALLIDEQNKGSVPIIRDSDNNDHRLILVP